MNFYCIPYREGEVQYSTFPDGTSSVHARFWRDGEYVSVKAKGTTHARNLITRNRTRNRKLKEEAKK